MKHLSDCMNESLNENQRVQITHAIDSGDFYPANDDYKIWLEFWEANVSANVRKKYKDRIKDPVGAHVIDQRCNVYIMPCESEENFEEGKKGSQMSEKIFLSVPKEALVVVKEADSKRKDGSLTWEEFVKQNQPLCEQMKKMEKSEFEKRW